ncbi:MAG: hypothetical protein N3D15_04780 [Syntrophorhabdaceae bacterium]|nr:hypothetical protein [Syntrophorhabdaceae bacterium]
MRKYSARSGMSSFFSLKGGSCITKAFILKKRSFLNLPSFTSLVRSLFVAKTKRTSTRVSFVSPNFINVPFSRTLNSFACIGGLISPISSTKNVPSFAISSRPGLLLWAPVKAPFL